MYFRTFFFLLFIFSCSLYFLSVYNPNLILNICGSMCLDELSLDYIKLTSMITSGISLILFIISDYYTKKAFLKEKERLATDRLNMNKILEELERLKN